MTKDKLKEIMVYNAVQLEKAIDPLRKQLAQERKSKKDAHVDPEALAEIQIRISQGVQSRFGFNDEQVMAAVDKYKAKEDPGFRDVLERITSILQSVVR